VRGGKGTWCGRFIAGDGFRPDSDAQEGDRGEEWKPLKARGVQQTEHSLAADKTPAHNEFNGRASLSVRRLRLRLPSSGAWNLGRLEYAAWSRRRNSARDDCAEFNAAI